MITDIKEITNILFFLIVGSITILSYLQARKTLFAPIRTEVFKLQLKIFEEVLGFFQNKTEIEFIKECDLNLIIRLNTYQMVDSYVDNFFASEVKIDKEHQKEVYKILTRAIVSEKYLRPITEGPEDSATEPPKKVITNPAILLSNWQKYEHPAIAYTEKLADTQAELKRLSISPILPSNIRRLITEFNDLITKNLFLVGESTTEFSQRMPDLAPRTSDLQKFNPSLAANLYNSKRIAFEPKAEEILTAINNYLKIEQLMH
ncbi:hypothetical protein [Pseudomonas sp. R76]|uniref:hypothetical protein n=1 Tax=Pseudomonas sp. R76 TaxID=1573711 RepID=UPI00131F4ED9|nr:hypothetical protein [Pseudomonas sp. R76]QHD05971.1 hypothetical protein PspR76_09520 [Pseudomonas sp. R76]